MTVPTSKWRRPHCVHHKSRIYKQFVTKVEFKLTQMHFPTAPRIYLIVLVLHVGVSNAGESCPASGVTSECETSNKRYILYDVNPPEGFNLRRDVYVRIAVFMRHLLMSERKYNWILVLPPWGNLYHWRSQDVGEQIQLAWRHFFDVESLKKFIPVIEMFEFFKEYPTEDGKTVLDRVYILQNDPKMFETGDFREKNEIIDCYADKIRYKKLKNSQFSGYFWGYSNVSSKSVKCVEFHGTMMNLEQNLEPATSKSFFFDHMEIPLHDRYGSRDFWQARRSMRYNSMLYKLANEFRRDFLNSTDEVDHIKRPYDWRDEKESRTALGGPYLAVHLRRQDFVRGRGSDVPTIVDAARQLAEKMEKLNLKKLFVATDADEKEYNKLREYLPDYSVYRYKPPLAVKNRLKDGGIAIIDQIICSFARYFIGTHESTFTFRIQEDREILGFPVSTTFNRLCGKGKKCLPASQWKIVY